MAEIFPENWANVTLKPSGGIDNKTAEGSTRKRKRKGTAGAAKFKAKTREEDKTAPAILGAQGAPTVSKQSVKHDVHEGKVGEVKVMAHDALQRLAGQPCDPAKIENLLSNVSRNLQQIVSMSNYKRVLLGCDTENLIYTNEIRPVEKKYEESFLRQAISAGERSCIRGENCECQFIDPTCPFVGAEFILPWETQESDRNGLCLPCIRAATQIFFFDLLQSSDKVEGAIQKHYNLHSQEGEYDLQAMLVCPPNGPLQNLPCPIVRHQRNFYKVYKHAGICYMKQIGIGYRESSFF